MAFRVNTYSLNSARYSKQLQHGLCLRKVLAIRADPPGAQRNAFTIQDAERCSSLETGHVKVETIHQNLNVLARICGRAHTEAIVLQCPRLLATPLQPWLSFLEGYGMTPLQMQNLLLQNPEVIVEGDLLTAGRNLAYLQDLGLDWDQVVYSVIAYCPRVLCLSIEDVNTLMKLWSKFGTGVDQRSDC